MDDFQLGVDDGLEEGLTVITVEAGRPRTPISLKGSATAVANECSALRVRPSPPHGWPCFDVLELEHVASLRTVLLKQRRKINLVQQDVTMALVSAF